MISIRDVVKKIAVQLGVSYEDSIEVIQDRPGKDTAYMLDSSKAKKELNWGCDVTLETGIENTIRWIKDNIDILQKLPFDYIHKA